MPYDFDDSEWELFSNTEKKIIVLSRVYKFPADRFHAEIRRLLNWPLPELKNEKTYRGQWSRLQAKMRKINKLRSLRASDQASEQSSTLPPQESSTPASP